MHLQTERLQLREFTLNDCDFLIALLNSEGWLKFIGERNVRTIDQAKKYLKDRIIKSYKDFGFGFYLVELKDSKIPIGMCGLVKRDFLKHLDLGFAFLSQYEGYGYGFEASKEVIQFAEEELSHKKLLAITDPENQKSIGLLIKLSFKFDQLINPDKKDLNLYSLETI
ncbi:MAG: GNAT family N-acetyltransferase [Bacteroidetes bacterium]|nr:GNAT family N-acetyltransferase [Bacteroidota bacterium]MBU1372862.1 GNAT family N-acetyltransferase [Bacteroidota bacterium]MBU1485591.1 GNAT family N-acetyltransferase [Bacteroidota bacterium]MBU1759794.1 GNAT family N-acetyltransferase [Bacteroidota bacterium]MBU2046819.1 GNAT family N-acetyltransferase [Bacteroidota bacterium]